MQVIHRYQLFAPTPDPHDMVEVLMHRQARILGIQTVGPAICANVEQPVGNPNTQPASFVNRCFQLVVLGETVPSPGTYLGTVEAYDLTLHIYEVTE